MSALPVANRAEARDWPDAPVLLGAQGSLEGEPGGGFSAPPYADTSEVVQLIRLVLRERFYPAVESVRTVESGVVEEQAVAAVENGRKTLVLRVWPVFFAHPRRVEYRFYVPHPTLRSALRPYLELLARVNDARLVEKP